MSSGLHPRRGFEGFSVGAPRRLLGRRNDKNRGKERLAVAVDDIRTVHREVVQ